jgi:hypothetical protein
MDIPLASIMADIFMTHLKTALMDERKGMGVYEWHRYVDNTFALVQLDTNVVNILAILNSFHSSIKFIYETDTSNCLSLL